MRRFIVTLVTVFSICCLVACGGEKTNDASTGSNNDEPEITAAPTVEEPTAEPTEEPTPEPTAEPTADPVETLTTLRDEALAAHSTIVEEVQYRFDVASEILEVAKGYSNFQENDTYELVLLVKSNFQDNVEEGDIEEIVGSSNSLNMVISMLLVEYPDLKTTEEFKKFVDAPALSITTYNLNVISYNSFLSNGTTADFKELPYCYTDENEIEY